MEDKDCIFCKIIRGEILSEKVYEDDNFIGILDIHPKAEGHTLIIPKKHFGNLLDMPSTLSCELMDAVKSVALNLIKNKKAEGFNLIVNNGETAGQVVHHAHLHIIPRKAGDGLKSMV